MRVLSILEKLGEDCSKDLFLHSLYDFMFDKHLSVRSRSEKILIPYVFNFTDFDEYGYNEHADVFLSLVVSDFPKIESLPSRDDFLKLLLDNNVELQILLS